MVRENPAMIQPLIQQLIAADPRFAQLVNQNPQALYELLAGGAGGEGEDDDEDMMGPNVMHVDLTQEEAAAVERVSTGRRPSATTQDRCCSSCFPLVLSRLASS